MLCCLGLFASFTISSMLGGLWTFISPAVVFGLGLLGDMKLMRGRHSSHGGFLGGCYGSGHAHHEKDEKGLKDPVCGMEVNERIANHSAEFEGRRYFFCSRVCMSMFEKDQRRYVK